MTKEVIFSSILVVICLHGVLGANLLKDATGQVSLSYETSSDGMKIEVLRNGEFKLSGTIGKGRNLEKVTCIEETLCKISDHEFVQIEPISNGFNVTWLSDESTEVFEDCYQLNSSTTNWYGGPQRYNQVWPLEKMSLDGSEPYIIKKSDNFGVAERYWLNSKGVYIWLTDNNPLWVDQNNKYDDQVCFKAEATSPYINRWRVLLAYIVVAMEDPKVAHLDAVNHYLGKPEKRPNDKMITEPIWTTWAKYKKPISDAIVLDFGNMIQSHGYEGGQLEIDDNWERCYGSQEFNTDFSNIETTISLLHDQGFRVTLWVHPFVNDDCEDNSQVGKTNGYFVRNPSNETNAVWWNGDNSHQIDFTKAEAAKWWTDRLKKIQQSPGIDSFKFDGGESDYVNQPPVFDDVELSPNILTQKYIETCVDFGDIIEVRASFRGQKNGNFIRMLDKDSTWGLNNGLATLITTLLQLNMNGYPMVLPDMIGGNGYGGLTPSAELMVRWSQANTFMPAMQFSYLPWEYTSETSYDVAAIVKKFVDLHAKYAPKIISAMEKSISDGTPVNPPIWWVDPTDPIALATSDEYLLGEDILVAPVIEEDTLWRDIYLPKGEWKDGNDGTIYTGPITLSTYPVGIDTLPYFIKQ